MADPVRDFSVGTGGAGPADGAADGVPEAAPASLLERMASELKAKVSPPDITLEVDLRPGYAVRYSSALSYEQLEAWKKASADKKKLNGIDDLRLSFFICTKQCTGILLDGQEVPDQAGEPVTFSSDYLHQTLGIDGVQKASQAVQKFLVLDGHVLAHAKAVLVAAGYGDEMSEAENPTSD